MVREVDGGRDNSPFVLLLVAPSQSKPLPRLVRSCREAQREYRSSGNQIQSPSFSRSCNDSYKVKCARGTLQLSCERDFIPSCNAA